ncbi:MAG TPA: heterodisulfide reductase-related iron-sulfur binding cluster [Candidatus Binatia bacterium]|nr:heterodisulfide reductase-related iron-sulfur binding cluster [Candidatus Binatia bacterium]
MAFLERRLLDACVHCGLCLAACPTYLELGEEADSPRGRIHLLGALDAGRLDPTADVVRHLDLCLGCRACETACPSGVEYGRLIEAARPWVEARRAPHARAARALLAATLASPARARAALAALRPFTGRAWLGRLARRAPAGIGRWLAFAAALPRPSRARLPAVVEPAGPARGTAVLLTGCVADAAFAATNRATAALLARAGVRVLVPPGQGCCGALATHLGREADGRRLAARTLDVLGPPAADWIVANAAGCGAHLRGYGHVLPGDRRAADVARRTRDALDLLDEIGLPAPAGALARSVAVHDPCHLAHGQGVRAAVRRLLGAIPGLGLVELEESDVCCGSAGTYNLTERPMAARLAERKLDRIVQSGAAVVAAANPGCVLQIRATALRRGVPVEVAHPLDLLAAAHGVAP